MKTQRFYQITVHFENFDHSIDRALLAQILEDRFQCPPTYYSRNQSPKEIADAIAEVWPDVKNVVLFRVPGRKDPAFPSLRGISAEYVVTSVFDVNYSLPENSGQEPGREVEKLRRQVRNFKGLIGDAPVIDFLRSHCPQRLEKALDSLREEASK